MDDMSREFFDKLEGIVADLDEVLGEYLVLDQFDCEEDISDVRESLSEVLYKIYRMV